MARFFILLALVAGLAGCTVNEMPSDAEKNLLLTEQDFADYGIEISDTPAGQFNKEIAQWPQSTELSYVVSDGDQPLYISSSLVFEKSLSDAFVTETAMRTGAFIGLKANGVEQQEIEIKRNYGQSAHLVMLVKDEKPIGNIFTMVKDEKVIFLTFSGIYFDDADDFDELISPELESIANYSERQDSI